MGCSCDNGGCAHGASAAMDETEARAALLTHARRTGERVAERYGAGIDLAAVERMVEDPEVVRFPVTLCFDGAPLEGEEFAYPLPVAGDPLNGYTLYLHPALRPDSEGVVAAVLYALVVVNYGAVADGAVAVAFGAACLGLDEDVYYDKMCHLADAIVRGSNDTPAQMLPLSPAIPLQ